MHRFCPFLLLAAAALLAACGSTEFVRVAPGQSVDRYLTERNSPPPEPQPDATAPQLAASRTPSAPAAEPALPVHDNIGAVADAFTRGKLALQSGQDQEAIRAFEETVRLDTNFVDAWTHLAFLYEKTGQSKKALEAFRRAKVAAIAPGTSAAN